MFFVFSTCKALPLFDLGVHPEDFGINIINKVNKCAV